jgi:RimJ/RimL family protein N-acetyltransferase
MLIRLAAQEDAQALWDLRVEALAFYPDAFAESVEEHRRTTVEAFAARLRDGAPDNFVMVACEADRVVGMAGFFREPRAKRRHKGVIWGVYIRPEARGRGVARALVTQLIQRARPIDGLRQIHLSVTAGQGAARALYASLGFRTFGVEPDSLRIDGRGIDQEHMYLPLSD